VLVTFEGIEGAGKSTLIAALATELRARGEDPIVTREPGGTPFGDAVRTLFIDPAYAVDPIAETMLVNASRAQLVAEVIAPALKAGTTVLCDRFFDATVAYQGYGRGLDIDGLLEICLAATHRIAPDLTFLLDIPVALSRTRITARGGTDRLEREDDTFHERVRTGYLALAKRFPRIHIIDGTAPFEAVHAAALAEIDHRRNLAL
jgi:dTMP kinase